MEPHHLTFAAVGRRRLFPDETTLRRAVRALLRVAGLPLILFCLVDDHIHAVLLGGRAAARRYGRSILLAMRPIAAAPIATPHCTAVENRRHLERLVTYVIQQGPHHGLDVHPALDSGSCFADLVGARAITDLGGKLRIALPRLRTEQIYEAAGLPAVCRPARASEIFAAGPARLVDAASAAIASTSGLGDRCEMTVDARAAVVQLGEAAGLPSAAIARTLDVSATSTLWRLRRRFVNAPLLAAVRLRLALEQDILGALSASPSHRTPAHLPHDRREQSRAQPPG